MDTIKNVLAQDHFDLVQISLYSMNESSHPEQFAKLRDIIGYSSDLLPFEVYVDDKAG